MLNGNEILKQVQQRKGMLISAIAEKYSDQPSEREILNRGVLGATPVFWDFSILESVQKGNKLFVGTILDKPILDHQLWIPDWKTIGGSGKPIKAMANVSEFGVCQILAVIVSMIEVKRALGFIVFMFVGTENNKLEVVRHFGLVSEPLPDRSVAIFAAAGLRFLEQPFVDNADLDQVAKFTGTHRQLKINDAKKIKIVYLRRREQHPTLSDGSPNPVDWSCQWLVQGHWRNQFHPSNQSHNPIFIQSYVKGPEDKPFKASPECIRAVVR